MTHSNTPEAGERARSRSEAYCDRRPHGRILVTVEVGPYQVAALERLTLKAVCLCCSDREPSGREAKHGGVGRGSGRFRHR